MQIGNKEILLVGDRVLIKPENPEERTKVGLYLPQTVVEKEPVQAGRVVATGPGIPLPNLTDENEPWKEHRETRMRYIPVQAEVGDYALFLRKEAVEIRYREEPFLVVPQSAILLLIRGGDEEPDTPAEQ
jgi:co-chaperonin GroES (HSP10)